ncbi:hypothetical protein ACHWQZ_G003866 [Mnemiopsis leidyi]
MMSDHDPPVTPNKSNITPCNFGIKYLNKAEHSNVRVSSQDLHKKSINELVDKVIGQAIQQLIEIRQEKGWGRICPEYLEINIDKDDYCSENSTENIKIIVNKFVNKLKESEISSGGTEGVMLIGSRTNDVYFEEFLTIRRKFKFYFKHPAIGSCSEPGNCGFILEVNPVLPGNPDSFNIELCTLPEEYKTDVHFHDKITGDKMHFALISRVGESAETYMITSYLGRPSWNGDNISWGSYRDLGTRSEAKLVTPVVFYDLT